MGRFQTIEARPVGVDPPVVASIVPKRPCVINSRKTGDEDHDNAASLTFGHGTRARFVR